MKLENVRLPQHDSDTLWEVSIENNRIESICPAQSTTTRTSTETPLAAPLLLPALCHPHIHLDKPYLLCSSHPRYSDLIPQDGSFHEALANTSQAKGRYDRDDLLLRGRQLIVESLNCGVSAMRAFVEVDHVTELTALEVGIELKRQFEGLCDVQIVAFAQDPLFSTEHGEPNRERLVHALRLYSRDISVLGTTPYVEASRAALLTNISWAIETAIAHHLHLDFHLDYNLDPAQTATVHDVIRFLKEQGWNSQTRPKTIVLGHCTHLTLLSHVDMQKLAEDINDAQLPISFVGLPTSDMFMMGRPRNDAWGGARPRGTLQVLRMIREFGFNVALGVNNVGNAFTPWGGVDPLRLASLGVGIYQDGTGAGAELLFECVSSRARTAIGMGTASSGPPIACETTEGAQGPFVLIHNKNDTVFPLNSTGRRIAVPARQYRNIRDVVWDPPDAGFRELIWPCHPTAIL